MMMVACSSSNNNVYVEVEYDKSQNIIFNEGSTSDEKTFDKYFVALKERNKNDSGLKLLEKAMKDNKVNISYYKGDECIKESNEIESISLDTIDKVVFTIEE